MGALINLLFVKNAGRAAVRHEIYAITGKYLSTSDRLAKAIKKLFL